MGEVCGFYLLLDVGEDLGLGGEACYDEEDFLVFVPFYPKFEGFFYAPIFCYGSCV